MAWKFKTDCRGKITSAAKRRLSSLKTLEIELDLKFHKDRSEFGYCYLEWKDNV